MLPLGFPQATSCMQDSGGPRPAAYRMQKPGRVCAVSGVTGPATVLIGIERPVLKYPKVACVGFCKPDERFSDYATISGRVFQAWRMHDASLDNHRRPMRHSPWLGC